MYTLKTRIFSLRLNVPRGRSFVYRHIRRSTNDEGSLVYQELLYAEVQIFVARDAQVASLQIV